jgi:hypothetical protein
MKFKKFTHKLQFSFTQSYAERWGKKCKKNINLHSRIIFNNKMGILTRNLSVVAIFITLYILKISCHHFSPSTNHLSHVRIKRIKITHCLYGGKMMWKSTQKEFFKCEIWKIGNCLITINEWSAALHLTHTRRYIICKECWSWYAVSFHFFRLFLRRRRLMWHSKAM